MNSQHDLFFACAPGVEELLAKELRELGATPHVVGGGADVRLDDRGLLRCAYGVGLATHVRLRVAKGPAKSLAQWGSAVDWHRYATGAPVVRAAGVGDELTEQLKAMLPTTSVGPDSWTVLARRDEQQVELTVDVAGDPLYKRGYRRGTAKAPLRPDLARALVILSGWTPDYALTDPFCGSGTIIAEAMLLAAKVPPAFMRRLACMDWPLLHRDAVDAQLDELSGLEPVGPPELRASDRDAGAVATSAENLARLSEALGWPTPAPECAALRSASHWSSGGYLISNPPHGGRVGKKDKLRNLYQSIGHVAQKHQMQLALLVADRKAAYATGVRLGSRLFTRHSGRKIWVMVQEGSP